MLLRLLCCYVDALIDFDRLRSHLGPNLDPTWTQVGAPDGSKFASSGVRRRHLYKMINRVETWSEWASQEGPNPWGTQGAAPPQERPRTAQDTPRAPQAQERPKTPQKRPRTLQEALQTPLLARFWIKFGSMFDLPDPENHQLGTNVWTQCPEDTPDIRDQPCAGLLHKMCGDGATLACSIKGPHVLCCDLVTWPSYGPLGGGPLGGPLLEPFWPLLLPPLGGSGSQFGIILGSSWEHPEGIGGHQGAPV